MALAWGLEMMVTADTTGAPSTTVTVNGPSVVRSPSASVAVSVCVVAPVAVGVPAMVGRALASVRPAGSAGEMP